MKNSDQLAVFDFDGTITSKDSFIEFIKYFHEPVNYYAGLIRLVPSIVMYFLGTYSNHKLKEDFFSYYFKGVSAKVMTLKGKDFGEKIIPHICHQAALDLISWHTEAGHDIMILSASSDIWLGDWCRMNGFELICTKFEVKDGHYTGKIKGHNCHGIQKKNVLAGFLSRNSYKYIYGYGDSKADSFFLELANKSKRMKLSDQIVKELDYYINYR